MALENISDLEIVSIGLAASVLALIVAGVLAWMIVSIDIQEEVKHAPEGQQEAYQHYFAAVQSLMERIHTGARSFLFAEYKYLLAFVIVAGAAIAGALAVGDDKADGVKTMGCFFIGALFSALAGFIGMSIATQANGRTAVKCVQNMSEGLKVSFDSGAVMSNSVVGLGMFGLSVLYLFIRGAEDDAAASKVWTYLSGFGFGASSIALFARVGGGVFTKAADVGADLTSKVENEIPEDDPRNPATIADNVGDNVGDVAGMGADLFESFVGSIIAASTLGATQTSLLSSGEPVANYIALPFWIAGFGMIMSLFGVLVVRFLPLPDKASLGRLLRQLLYGTVTASILTVIFSGVSVAVLFDSTQERGELIGCIVIGLLAGMIIGYFTEYCTAYDYSPTQGISEAAEFGPAPVIIKGLGVGMISVTVPTIVLAITVLACDNLSGLYGIAIAAVGLLSTLGITLATDAYGPVADNAGGIAEMSGLPPVVRSRTDALDSLGNTTAATGKGFAVGSAVLTAAALIAAFLQQSGLQDLGANKRPGTVGIVVVDLRDPTVLTGLLIGAMLPFVFAALTMLSVDKSARAIIREVRLQFALAPELLGPEGEANKFLTVEKDGQVLPNSERCVASATTSAVQEMILPGTIAVFAPIIVGFLLGVVGLAGLLVGALTSGFMLALTMANAGGAWDNAKKWVEKCAVDGEEGANGRVTFTHYGIKKGKVMDEHLHESGNDFAPFMPHHWSTAPEPDSPEAAELKRELEELYHNMHEPAVIGDTVGDPFKDTSGPSLNILIKLMSMVSLMLAPTFNSLNEPQGFGPTGWWIALIIFIIVTVVCFAVLHWIHSSNEELEREVNEKTKDAHQKLREQRNRAAQHGGDDKAPADDEEAGVGARPAAAADEEHPEEEHPQEPPAAAGAEAEGDDDEQNRS